MTFFTKPIPLPIWLWNILVIAIYLSVIVFVLQFAAVILVGVMSLFFS